jgi:hypothetical protein
VTVAYSELLDLIWIAPLAVLIVSTTFSLALLGATRAGEHRRAGSPAAALGFSALALVSGLAFAALVVAAVGLIVAG